MTRPFLGAFLGSLLQPLITRAGRKAGGAILFAFLLAGAWLVQWFVSQPMWLRALIVTAFVVSIVGWLVERRQPQRIRSPRRVPLDEQPHFLYRWFSPDGELLYIGISNDLARRTGQHIADKPWMQPGVRCEAESYPNRAAVIEAEERAIYAENPTWNVVHNRGPLW